MYLVCGLSPASQPAHAVGSTSKNCGFAAPDDVTAPETTVVGRMLPSGKLCSGTDYRVQRQRASIKITIQRQHTTSNRARPCICTYAVQHPVDLACACACVCVCVCARGCVGDRALRRSGWGDLATVPPVPRSSLRNASRTGTADVRAPTGYAEEVA